MKKNKNALFGNKYVNIRNSELKLGNYKVNELIKEFNTPAFVFLQEKIKKNIQKIKKCFNDIFPNSRGFYSMKANYFTSVMKTVKKEGFGAEIIGSLELESLKYIDFPFNSVIGGGPYLPNTFLQDLIKQNVEYIVVYDLDDMKRIDNEIQKQEKNKNKQKILIRFRSPKYTGRQGIIFSPENLKKLKDLFYSCSNLEFKGILSHLGSRLNALPNYKKNVNFIIKVVQALKIEADLDTEIINYGGGYPNADAMKEKYFKSLLMAVKKELTKAKLDNCQIFYEPGRFIVGDTGFCLAKVIKYDQKHNTAFLNVGNNFIPKFMKSSLRFYNVDKITENPNFPIDFMGNIPSDQDILVKKYNFTPSIKAGDYIMIANVGAYALTWSTRFPYPFPSIVFIDDKSVNLVHSRKKKLRLFDL